MRSCFVQLAVSLLLGGFAGCATSGDFRSRMAEAAEPGAGVQQTHFAHFGEVQTAKGTFHVAVQRRILTGMLAPRGLPQRLLLFDKHARLAAAYEADFSNRLDVGPLWCAGSRVYLFGFGSFHFAESINHKIDPDPLLSCLFSENQTPTGNVIDFCHGPLAPVLTRDKSYGSLGSIEDDPWRPQ
jgi:hypothetical protein